MDETMKRLYQEERSKLSPLPDADSDFMALYNALEMYVEESCEK